jgi:hypothetical protein
MNSRDSGQSALLEALAQPGCALCRLAQDAVTRFLDAVLYESVNDVEWQARLKESRGFCPTHSELLLQQRNALGAAIIYRAILRQLRQDLGQISSEKKGWLDRLAELGAPPVDATLAPAAACPACNKRDEATSRYLGLLRRMSEDAGLRAALRKSAGFCLFHLAQAQKQLEGPVLQQLLKHQAELWERLDGELAEFIRKKDYRFQAEGYGEEADSWQRAARITSGEPGVF